jgi:predicted kinase
MNRPSLILLVGIPGSGKTTYAEKYIEENPNTVHLSSDKIRAELWGNEATQGDNNKVFSLMQSRAIDALNNGQSVVYDATNITRKDRSYIISICPKFVKIEAHVIFAPIETCIERDAARERTVGKEVIDRMLKRFQAVYYDEGIHEIKIIRPENFNSLQYLSDILEAMKIPHDNPHHALNIYDHCCEAQDYAYKCGKDDTGLVALAAMVHDAGKPYVKAFVDGKGNPCETAHYYQHHCISAWLAYGIYGASVPVNIAWLCSVHMDPFLNTKYYNKLPAYLKKQVDLLHEADRNAH